jgi:branched-chain amino acid aminotransferase
MQSQYVNINGKLVPQSSAGLPVDNKAFRYGAGLFETMLVLQGHIELLSYHSERLFSGARQLGFNLPTHANEAWMAEEILRTVHKNKLEKLCRVRLQLYPGTGGVFENLDAQSEYVIECFPLEEDVIKLNNNGLVIGIASGVQKSADSLAHLKSTSALIYADAARQAKVSQWNDALILNTSGNIVESTIANIFWVKNEVIYTPLLSEGCIAGVMRRRIMVDLQSFGFFIEETKLTETVLLSADEVFLTNAIRRLKWVGTCNGQRYSNHIIKKVCNHLFDIR